MPLDLAGLYQQAEGIKANRLTSRINELRYSDALKKDARSTQRGDILAGAVGPQGKMNPQAAKEGLMGAGLVDEAYDFQKMQDLNEMNSTAIKQSLENLKGTKLTNTKKKFNVVGMGALALVQGFNKLLETMPRDSAILKMQPAFDRVKGVWAKNNIDIGESMATYDPEQFASLVNMSNEAMTLVGQQETRAQTKKTAENVEYDRMVKRAQKLVKNKDDAEKRLSDIAKQKAMLLSRETLSPGEIAMFGELNIDANNKDAVDAAIKQWDREARGLRRRYPTTLNEIFGG